MVLSLLFVSLMVVQLCATVPTANATPNSKLIPVGGDVIIYYGDTLWSHASRSINHTFATQNALFEGNFTGEVMVYWSIIEYSKTNEMKMVGVGTFTGTMGEKSGTFTFIAIGWGSGETLTFHNEWRIIKGTGDFSHIHGEGTLDGYLTTPFGSYLGEVCFTP